MIAEMSVWLDSHSVGITLKATIMSWKGDH